MMIRTIELLALGLAAWPWNCNRPVKHEVDEHAGQQARVAPMDEAVDLVLKVSLEPKGEVGYGAVFSCEVKQVMKGGLGAKKILMTVLASDHAQRALFDAQKHSATMEVGFKKGKDNEPYGMMPITGFVDESKTSWRLVYAR